MASTLLLGAPALAEPTASPSRIWVEGSARDVQSARVEAGVSPPLLLRSEVLPTTEPWEVTVFVEAEVSGPGSIRRLADLLIRDLDRWVEMGTLRIVRADPEPRTVLVPSTDRGLIERGLYDLYFNPEASDRIRQVRSQWFHRDGGSSTAIESAQTESRLLRARRDTLLTWLAEEGSSEAPRLLLLLDEGLGLDPSDYYLDGGASLEIPQPPSGEELAQVAAALGWIVAPIRTTESADDGGIEYRATEETPIGFRVGIGGGDRSELDPNPLADDAQIAMAEAALPDATDIATQTAGQLITDSATLRDLLRSLERRQGVDLLWPAMSRGEILPLRVLRPNGQALRAPTWAGPDSGEAIAEARLRRLGAGGDEGDLPLRVVIATPAATATGSGELLARAEGSLLSEVPPSLIRISIALQLDPAPTVFRHQVVAPTPLPGGDFEYRTPLPVPANTAAALVAIEDLDGSNWGVTYAQFTRQALAPDSELEGSENIDWLARIEENPVSERTVRILPLPATGSIEGRVEVTAETSDAVDRLVFLFDGDRHADLDQPPFTTRVKLGRRGERHIVEAIAYDDQGSELGRDFLVLNESAETFWVRITSPESGDHVGPILVEAEVQTPEGEPLERLDYYWRDQLIATSREAPHERRILIPYADASGFIRVEAQLISGRTTEDVVLMNSARFGAQVEVQVVELYVVVTDRDGKPVLGLGADAFEVLDSGVEQTIDGIRQAGDLPLTVGLAIDSSGSLFAKLPRVQTAAANFVEGLSNGRDEAFLVGFGSRPRVVQSSTRNLGRVSRGISDLAAGGRTAVWEAVVLSLLQLQDVDGRKALVVFYDGDDEDEDFSYRTALQLAKETGVPIYMIVMNNTAARTNGQGFRTRSFTGKLERIAQAGGGRVYYVPTDANLETIYEAISDELRSHYLISYTPTAAENDSVWRSVEVNVKGRGLEARTLSGYTSGYDVVSSQNP